VGVEFSVPDMFDGLQSTQMNARTGNRQCMIKRSSVDMDMMEINVGSCYTV
jgi:hypothetical protein